MSSNDPLVQPAALRSDGSSVGAELAFRLKVGDRFPLIKRVSQTLRQSVGGATLLSRSDLVLLMAITVDREENGRKLLTVRYERVQYSHDIAGQKVEFDSRHGLPPNVPDVVKAYAGLVDNGFSFWLGPDNRITGVVGFDRFLQQCVRNIAPERRADFLRRLAITEEDQGVANFVDDSIGLLPRASDNAGSPVVQVGQTWTRRQELFHPIPLVVSTQYTLSALTDYEATIDVVGRITPSTVATYDPETGSDNGPQVVVKGGHVVGQCNVDRRTGLPLFSRIERFLELAVRLPDGRVIPETKSVITTVQAFPQQPSSNQPLGRSAAAGSTSGSGVVPASAHAVDPRRHTSTDGAAGVRLP